MYLQNPRNNVHTISTVYLFVTPTCLQLLLRYIYTLMAELFDMLTFWYV